MGPTPPEGMFFNASESDLSDGHLIFARDRVEFCAFGTFWAMSEIRIEGAWGGRHPPCIYLKGDQSPCILDPQMFWFCIAGLSRTGIHRKYVFPELSERKISDFRREISVASNQKEAHSHAIFFEVKIYSENGCFPRFRPRKLCGFYLIFWYFAISGTAISWLKLHGCKKTTLTK